MNIRDLIAELNYSLSEGTHTPETIVYVWVNGERYPIDLVDSSMESWYIDLNAKTDSE